MNSLMTFLSMLAFLVFAVIDAVQLQEVATNRVRANPIRKVVTMLHSIQTKVEAEGEKEKAMFDKYMCYCKTSGADLEKSIDAAGVKMPEVSSEIKEAEAKKAGLDEDLVSHKADRTAAESAVAEATALREKEAAAFAAKKAEYGEDIAAIEKAVAALEKGMAGAFLQTGAAKMVQKLFQADDLDVFDDDRKQVLAFLSGEDSSEYAPSSGEITGILKQLMDTMAKGLSEETATEKAAVAAYEELVAAKKKEIEALTGAIEAKTLQSGELAVSIVEMKDDLADTEAAMLEDKKFLEDLASNCDTKKKEWDDIVKTRSEELLAISETIKVLNDDDALDLWKKTLPSSAASFLQVKASATSLRARALAVLRASGASKAASPRLDLIALALHSKSTGFEKVITMVDEMVTLLFKEQEDDDSKKEYCGKEFDKTDDKKKGLERAVSDAETAIAEVDESIATLTSEIAALVEGIKELDKSVAEATEQRKEEHGLFTELIASNSAAKDLLGFAKNRLNKFYNPSLYVPPPKQELSEEDRIVVNFGGTAPPTPAPGGIAGTGISFTQVAARSAKEVDASACMESNVRALGVLDIAGFESFETNSLEQLMINLSNEYLQQHFNKVMFKEEIEECESQCIQPPSSVGFVDNADCLALIDAKGGILDLLEETMVVPRATDTVFVATKVLKLPQTAEHPRIILPKVASLSFGVKHFAGNVVYSCDGWLEKNADKPPGETSALLAKSSLAVLREIAGAIEEKPNDTPASRGKARRVKSVTSGFRSSLKSLMTKIAAADPHFIRCIKPNEKKVPNMFVSRMVMEQLLFSGVLATVKIRQLGYPYRIPHTTFIHHYTCIARRGGAGAPTSQNPSNAADPQEKVEALLERLAEILPSFPEGDSFAVGISKVFMRLELYNMLEDCRRQVAQKIAIVLQQNIRGYHVRKQLKHIKELQRELCTLLDTLYPTSTLGVRSELVRPSAELRRPSVWAGDSIVMRCGSFDALQDKYAEMALLLSRANDLGFRNVYVIQAEACQARMGVEVDAMTQVESVKHSIDPVSIERVIARARSLGILSPADAAALDSRISNLNSQVPLVKAIESALVGFGDDLDNLERAGDDDAAGDIAFTSAEQACLEQLQEIVGAVAQVGLDTASDKWISELGGAVLFEKVSAHIRRLQAKRELAERQEQERRAAEERRAEEERRAAEEAKLRDEVNQRLLEEAAKAAQDEEKMTRMSSNAPVEELSRCPTFDPQKSEITTQESIRENVSDSENQKTSDADNGLSLVSNSEDPKTSDADKGEGKSDAKGKVKGKGKSKSPRSQSPRNVAESSKSQSPRAGRLERAGLIPKSRRVTITGLIDQEKKDILSRLQEATEDYNTEKLEECLRKVAENAIDDDADGDEFTGCIAKARKLFEQLQSESFVVSSLKDARDRAAFPQRSTLDLRQVENLTQQLKTMGGHEKEVLEASKTLQSNLRKRAASDANILSQTEVEMATRVFKNLALFSRLKPAGEWSRHRSRTRSEVGGGRSRRASDLNLDGMEEDGSMLMYSKKEITTSLTRVPETYPSEEEYSALACQNFQNLLVCMGSRPAQQVQRDACRDAVIHLASNTPSLKDEIYVQMLKQLTGNPSSRSLRLGWQLLLHLCQQSPPDDELVEFVRAFIEDVEPQLTSGEMSGIARSCLTALNGEDKRVQAAESLLVDENEVSRMLSAAATVTEKLEDVANRLMSKMDASKVDPLPQAQTAPAPKRSADLELDSFQTAASRVVDRLNGGAMTVASDLVRLRRENEEQKAEIKRLKEGSITGTPTSASNAADVPGIMTAACRVADRLDKVVNTVTANIDQLRKDNEDQKAEIKLLKEGLAGSAPVNSSDTAAIGNVATQDDAPNELLADSNRLKQLSESLKEAQDGFKQLAADHKVQIDEGGKLPTEKLEQAAQRFQQLTTEISQLSGKFQEQKEHLKLTRGDNQKLKQLVTMQAGESKKQKDEIARLRAIIAEQGKNADNGV